MGWPVVTVASGGIPVTDNSALGYGCARRRGSKWLRYAGHLRKQRRNPCRGGGGASVKVWRSDGMGADASNIIPVMPIRLTPTQTSCRSMVRNKGA
jgi:hypothetical protein